MSSKFFKIILPAVVVVFLIAGYLYFAGKIKFNNEPVEIEEIAETTQEIEIAETETSDWKTYRNEEYGFEVEYPTSIFQLDKNTNTLSHTLKNFHKYSMKDGSDLGLANDISIIFKKENERGCNWLETGLGLKSLGVAFEFKNIRGVKYETGAEGEGVIYYCVKNKDNQNIFLIERLFLNTSYSTELPKQNDYINNERQENILNQILSTFKFTNGSILLFDDFKKISDFAEANDISKNPNRDLVIASGFEVETYGDYKPFNIVSIRGILNGNYREYTIGEDSGSLYFSVLNDNNYESMSDDDILNARKMTKLVLSGIENKNLSEIDKWRTYKSEYGFEFKYPQEYTPLRDEEADNIDLKLVTASASDKNIKIASSPNDPNPSGKFFQTEMPYMRIKTIKGIYGPENWLSTRKNEYFPNESDVKNQRKIDIDGKGAVELTGPGSLGALYKVIVIQGKENLIIITQDLQTEMFDQILSTFKFTD